jgi:DNA-directed RNA polymerase subunit RPC12/RpoP
MALLKSKKVRKWCTNSGPWSDYHKEGKPPKVRCPVCSRRITLKPIYEMWDSNIFDYWMLPRHKTKPISAIKQAALAGKEK